MFQIAIVEDDDIYAKSLEEYLGRFQKEEGIIFDIKRFYDGEEIVDAYNGCFDIILMDIEMKYMDGMEAAEKIRAIDNQVELLFVTNMAQYAVKGYKVRALDYIVKPVEYIPFSESMKRAIRNSETRKVHYFTINFKDGMRKVSVEDILWIDSQGHRLTFHMIDGICETTIYSMKEIETKLGEGFCRCNNGILVNLRYASKISGGQVIVSGTPLPISRGRKNDFMEKMVSYLSK